MNDAFTPGPWVATEYEIGCGSAFVRIGSMTVSGTYRGGEEDTLITEDARLIAAAPELLAACQAQHRAIDILMAKLIALDSGFMPTKSAAWEACILGHSAITKATGEAS